MIFAMGKKRNKKMRSQSGNINYMNVYRRRVHFYTKPVRKSEWYRESWKPLLGRMILIEGIYSEYRDYILGGYGIKNVLVKDVHILRRPKEFKDIDFGTLDHLWVLVDKNLMKRIGARFGDKIRLSGHVVEYVNYRDHEAEYRNIGLQVLNAAVVRNGDELF